MIDFGKDTLQVGQKHILLTDVLRNLVKEMRTIFPDCRTNPVSETDRVIAQHHVTDRGQSQPTHKTLHFTYGHHPQQVMIR